VSKQNLPVFNLSIPEHKKMLINHVKALEGVHRVEVTKVRGQRSNQANAYYWAVVVPCIQRAILDAWGEQVDGHEFGKYQFLRKPVVNHETGEVVGYVARGTSTLNTEEFAAYIDDCVHLCSMLGVEIPPPSHYGERDPAHA